MFLLEVENFEKIMAYVLSCASYMETVNNIMLVLTTIFSVKFLPVIFKKVRNISPTSKVKGIVTNFQNRKLSQKTKKIKKEEFFSKSNLLVVNSGAKKDDYASSLFANLDVLNEKFIKKNKNSVFEIFESLQKFSESYLKNNKHISLLEHFEKVEKTLHKTLNVFSKYKMFDSFEKLSKIYIAFDVLIEKHRADVFSNLGSYMSVDTLDKKNKTASYLSIAENGMKINYKLQNIDFLIQSLKEHKSDLELFIASIEPETNKKFILS